MIAAWGLYCVVVAGLLGLAARAAEAALGAYRRPVRWVWAGALLGSLAVPLGAWVGWPWGVSPAPTAGPAPFALLDATPIVIDLSTSPAAGLLDRPLLAIWLLCSGAMAAVVALATARLRRARAAWRSAVVDGRPVLVSSDVGPAAFGVLRGAIVLPGWALALDRRLRGLMLLHEEEHLRAGDPRLVLAALLALAAMPWNPALWWQFRRLRQALELDCDARVLRRVPDVRGYGALLLEVGRRRCGGGLVVAALSEPRSFLERRIRMLAKGNPRMRPGRAVVGAAVAAGLAVWACEAPEPTRTVEPIQQRSASEGIAPITEAAAAAGIDCAPAVFVDGVLVGPLARVGNRSGILDRLDPDEIAKIEIVKGRAAGLLAGAASEVDASCGAIVITTKAAAASAEGDATASSETRRARVKAVQESSRGATSSTTERRSILKPLEEGGDFAPFTPDMTRPDLVNRAEVARALETSYPPLLRDAGIGGTTEVLFWIDETGQVARTELGERRSGHAALDEAAMKVADTMRFLPARKGAEPVKVVVSIPITFRTR